MPPSHPRADRDIGQEREQEGGPDHAPDRHAPVGDPHVEATEHEIEADERQHQARQRLAPAPPRLDARRVGR